MRDMSRSGVAALAIAASLTMTGCAAPDAKPPAVAKGIDQPAVLGAVTDMPFEPVIDLELRAGDIDPRAKEGSDWPDLRLDRYTSKGTASLATVLREMLLFSGSNIGLDVRDPEVLSRIVWLEGASGPLGVLVERACAAAAVSCVYADGLLTVAKEATYVVQLPFGIGRDAALALAVSVERIVGTSVELPEHADHLVFQADSGEIRQVREFFTHVRRSPLVMMHVSTWRSAGPVNIAAASAGGPDVDADATLIAGGVSVPVSPGPSAASRLLKDLGATEVGAAILPFASGGRAEYAVTMRRERPLWSGLGEVRTKTDETGTVLSVGGLFKDGMVFAEIEADFSSLAEGSTVEQFGKTFYMDAKRHVSQVASVKMRPGDVYFLSVSDQDGMPGDGKARHVLLSPQIVRFLAPTEKSPSHQDPQSHPERQELEQ